MKTTLQYLKLRTVPGLKQARIHAPVCMYQDIDRAINLLTYGMPCREILDSLIEFAQAIVKG